MTETKPEIPAPQSKEDLDVLGRRLRVLNRGQQKDEQRKQDAIAKINDKFDPKIADYEREQAAICEAIINYAIAHKDELADGTQTIVLNNIDIKWHTDGNGSLEFLVDEQAIVTNLERLRNASQFVAIKKSIKKDPIKKDSKIMKRLAGKVRVKFTDTIMVIIKPTLPETRRGIKPVKQERILGER